MIPNEGTALNPIRVIARSRIRRSRWSLQNMRASCANVGMKESKAALALNPTRRGCQRNIFQGQDCVPMTRFP